MYVHMYTYIYNIYTYIYNLYYEKKTNEIHTSSHNTENTLSLEIHCIPAYPGAIIKEIIEPFCICTKIYVCTHNVLSILWLTVCFKWKRNMLIVDDAY